MVRQSKRAKSALRDQDRRKSLQDLDGEDWGEPRYPSHVVTSVHRLRRVSLQDFTIEDLRLMIGQRFSATLPYLVPLAIEHLREDPFAHGDFYPGDLLLNVLKIDAAFWRAHPALRQETEAIAGHAVATLSDEEAIYDTPLAVDAERLTRAIKEALDTIQQAKRR